MKRVVCVFGSNDTGKSTYIYHNFKDEDILDIYTFQEPKAYPLTMNFQDRLFLAQSLFEREVSKRCEKLEGTLVLEGTYLLSSRRASLIQTIKNYGGKDIIIDCIYLMDSGSRFQIPHAPIDIPSNEEGFDNVVVIDKKELQYTEEELKEADEWNNERKKQDYVTEYDLLGYRYIKDQFDIDDEKFNSLFNDTNSEWLFINLGGLNE